LGVARARPGCSLARVRGHLDAELVAVFDRYELSPADFQVIVTLRRAGAPF
jgi:hypothetical protein